MALQSDEKIPTGLTVSQLYKCIFDWYTTNIYEIMATGQVVNMGRTLGTAALESAATAVSNMPEPSSATDAEIIIVANSVRYGDLEIAFHADDGYCVMAAYAFAILALLPNPDQSLAVSTISSQPTLPRKKPIVLRKNEEYTKIDFGITHWLKGVYTVEGEKFMFFNLGGTIPNKFLSDGSFVWEAANSSALIPYGKKIPKVQHVFVRDVGKKTYKYYGATTFEERYSPGQNRFYFV